jgi:hypothetical protein
MQETKFWDVISLLNWDEEGDDEHVGRPALEALSQMKEEDIMRFDDIMSEKLHAIDTRDHARFGYLGELDPEVGDEYISPDDFLYLRCAVVAKGKPNTRAASRRAPACCKSPVVNNVAGELGRPAREPPTKPQPRPVGGTWPTMSMPRARNALCR